MIGDFTVSDVVVDDSVREAIGVERTEQLDVLIRSVKRWKKREIEDLVQRLSKRVAQKEMTLTKLRWDEDRLEDFMLIVYRESFPPSLIGDNNADRLIRWISAQFVNSGKWKKPNPKDSDSASKCIKYRFINWLKKLRCEKAKRMIVSRVAQFIVEYMKCVVKSGFKTIHRGESTIFVPINQYRHFEKVCFTDYENRCMLTKANQEHSTFDLKLLPIGSSVRPIVMSDIKTVKEKRKREKVALAALLYHSRRFGVSSETIANCRKKIAKFSSKSKDEIFYLKSDICKFYPSIYQSELGELLKNIIGSDCVVLTIIDSHIVKGRKRLKIWNKAVPVESANEVHDSLLNPNRASTKRRISSTVVVRHNLLRQVLSNIKHTVKYKGDVYTVGRGIAQGSTFSSLLGDIYLHERLTRICVLPPRQTLILSYADDFIILSHHKHVIEKYYHGIFEEDMGIKGNNQKTITNVTGTKRPILHWCGLTFNTVRFALLQKKSV